MILTKDGYIFRFILSVILLQRCSNLCRLQMDRVSGIGKPVSSDRQTSKQAYNNDQQDALFTFNLFQ